MRVQFAGQVRNDTKWVSFRENDDDAINHHIPVSVFDKVYV